MSKSDLKTLILSNWPSIVKIIGGVVISCVLFYLNATYVTKNDFIPVAQQIKGQAQQISYVNAEVKNISRRLSKIVDNDGNPVNTDKMVEIQKDITKILVKMESLNEKIDRLEKNK